MSASRIELAFGDSAPEGRTLLIGPDRATDLSPFDRERTEIVQPFFPDATAIEARGFKVGDPGEGKFDTIVVFLARSRALIRGRIALAVSRLAQGGTLWIDGQKTDGIDSVLKEMRDLSTVDEVHSRAHGKIFRVELPAESAIPGDWALKQSEVSPGFITVPGVFSADGPDPASEMLAAALPERLPTRIVDLGAGWGWLSAQILTHPGVDALHLVEADRDALDCARLNVTDPRATFHWADALTFRLAEPVNGVIMNPPFHSGRDANSALGVGFIQAAARMLTGAGRLWMVANRHLPYEAALRSVFADVAEIGGDNRFKVLTATGAGRGGAGKGRSK